MKKLLMILCLCLPVVNYAIAGAELTTLWQKSAADGTLPKWYDTNNFTRGLSYGKVGGQDYLFVVSRNGGSFIYYFNPATGDSLGMLDNTGLAGGNHVVSDVEVSGDGFIFVCNLAVGGTFKVYKWSDVNAAPVEVVAYDATGKRLGDKFTVTGSTADNSVVIWAASATTNEVIKFTTTDNAATFTPEVIAVGVTGGSASVGPVVNGAGSFYWNAGGQHVRKFDATGSLLGTVPGTVVATGSNAIRYITATGTVEYFVTFQYGAGNENARIVRVPGGDLSMAKSYTITLVLGSNANANGAGDVSVKDNGDGTFNIFVLSCNNGLGAYKVQFPVPPVDPVNMVLNWELGAGAYPFFANDNNTRGIAYNPATGHLLVASRTGGHVIYALDAATGIPADTLDMTGVLGGTYNLNKVVVDADGVIYAGNLALANGEFKLYRWADESAAPTLAYAGVTTNRYGDALGIAGTGIETVIYVSGSGSTAIGVFTTVDGINYTAAAPIPVTAGTARGSISPIASSAVSGFWINGSGTTTRHIDTNGALVNEIPGTVVASSWMNVAYIAADNGAKLVAVNANNVAGDRRKLQIWDITESETAPVPWATGEAGTIEFANTNGTGEVVAHDNGDGTYTVFQCATNNVIASWTMDVPYKIPPVTGLPIFEGATNGNFDLPWEFNTEAGAGTLEIADSTASAWGSHVLVFTDSGYTGLAYVKDALFLNYTIEADVYLVGEAVVDFPLYSGIGIKMQADVLKYYRFVFRNSTSSGHGQLRLQGYDGASWHISKYFEPGVDFQPLETGWHNFKVTVVGNSFWAYIDGQLLPGCPYTDASPFMTEGYPGMFVYNTGVSTLIFDNFSVTEPVLPVSAPQQLATFWAKTNAAGTFPAYVGTGNYTRGMAYGNVGGNDRVYVVTRNGNPHRVVIHEAMTGDSVGVITAPTVPVGYFPVNCVDVSDDGIIFVCNMTLDASTAAFTVYRYDSETADPVAVISYNASTGRMGDMFSVYGSASDNSLAVYAGKKDGTEILKFTTLDNGATFTPEVITLPAGALGTVPNVAQAGDGSIYVKSYAKPLVHYNADGTVIDTVSTTVFPTSVTKIKYFESNGSDYLIGYYPDVPGAGGAEKLMVLDLTYGDEFAYLMAESPSIGKVANGNGTGSADVMLVDSETIMYFIFGTNNGVAAFTNNEEYVVASNDTLFYGDTPTLLPNPYAGGYIAGTNDYQDIGKYQRFDFNAGDMLYGFRPYFAVKEIVGDPDTVMMVVKTVAASGAPDSLLASVITTTEALDTTMAGNLFLLDSPLMLEGPIFIGFEWDLSYDDAFAIYTDTDGEGDNANRVWERFSDGSYNDFGSLFNPSYSWLIDVDLWIAAYYKKGIPSAVDDLAGNTLPTGFELSQNYPNPFNPTTSFRVALPKRTDVKIIVFNMLGQQVKEVHDGYLEAGVHIFDFDGRGLASGVYFYRVEAGDIVAVKRMLLIK